MTRVTVGQYYPGDSIIHRLDARVKLLGVLFYVTSLFFVRHYIGYMIAAVFLFSLIGLSHVPVKLLIKGLRPVLFMLLFAVTLNLFLTPGDQVIFRFYFIRLTYEGLYMAGKMGLRLVLLITGSSVLTLTTSPIRLTDAIEALLKPLKRVKVPAHEIAMMLTIALGSIPMLMEETDRIIKAQTARGADFDTGGLIKKAKSLIPVLVPLFGSAFRRADEMAVAMDARCYRGDHNRTKLRVPRMISTDYYAIGCLAVYGVMLFATRWL